MRPARRRINTSRSAKLYGLCLHSGLMRALVPFQGDGVHRHDFPIFRKNWTRWLRQDRGKKMPIVVVDPAYIDVLYWSEQRRLGQAVMITREKENMKPTVISHYAFDPQDPVNLGVEADDMAGYTYAYLRRIVYRDPASGERFIFLPTEKSLRPGVIALLYFLRWKIEKTYDVFKNKLHQQKANGETAALTQAHLTALTHNLLTILLCTLDTAGISEQKIERATRSGSSKLPRVNGSQHRNWCAMPRSSPASSSGWLDIASNSKPLGGPLFRSSSEDWTLACSALPDTDGGVPYTPKEPLRWRVHCSRWGRRGCIGRWSVKSRSLPASGQAG